VGSKTMEEPRNLMPTFVAHMIADGFIAVSSTCVMYSTRCGACHFTANCADWCDWPGTMCRWNVKSTHGRLGRG
jgi:hypothetical protein